MGAMIDQFIELQQNRQYDASCPEGIGRNIFLQIVGQPTVERVHVFSGACKFGTLVAGHGTPAVVVERVGRGAIGNLAYESACEDRAF